MSKKNLTKEIKIGGGILSLYALWAIAWFLYKYFIKGTINRPYAPLLEMKTELALPFSKGLILGADLLGRSLLEVLSAGLTYSLTISIIVTVTTASVGIIMGYLAVRAPGWFKLVFDLLINLIFIFPSIQ